ncbi:MAG: adenylate/guanylate cyclase domain-containing protein [Deltaproteobacteria bacterium]|nr:adenylate/guanylate cyclase domain-containing protein [Deltaproteobacteria bacterium]MBW2344118.1 adenylate/guanylate cyclase domain-containing protein [Deltaproteobacteria bacterium]
MTETNQLRPGEWPDPNGVSLRGLYVIGAMATTIGIIVVFVLNVATPMDFVLNQLTELTRKQGGIFGFELAKRLLGLLIMISAICSLALLVIHQLLRPVAGCLTQVRAGKEPQAGLAERARHRLINLPFVFIPFNLAMWMLIPALIFISAHLIGRMSLHTAVVLSVRASMVGLISSAIAFFRIESYCRRQLIPFFFPHGRLALLKGAARISISRRIRMFYRLGSLVPLTILMVTLLTLQWEVDSAIISAEEYGRGLITFTLILCGFVFFSGGVLNRLVSRSIVDPIDNMLNTIDRIQDGNYNTRIKVVSNDEIGILGDAGNAMIKGLAEREVLRATFGRYVTPEIRDEILAGRIPLEGDRREATVLFADLRNFTPFVENNPPEKVIAGMRAYFTAMHRAIRRHKGLVLQFVGDEIEAVFGIPVHFPDHADAAVRAALDMRRELDELNSERSARGRPSFAHGIGIHSGKVLAGNSGSEEQSAYALIGNTVNVASRIQNLTKELGCDILVSQETVERLEDSFQMDKQPPRLVKGYSKPVIVHRIL